MITFYGQPASFGLGMGVLIQKEKPMGNRTIRGEIQDELELFEEGCVLADSQYEQMVIDARNNFGNAVAMMVWAHQLLIKDEGFRTKIKELIQAEKLSANTAIMMVAMEVVKPMSDSTDAYLRERRQDILYVAEWLMNCCSLIREQVHTCEFVEAKESQPIILIGRNFGLEDVLAAKHREFAGMIDLEGSLESHTVMLAKELKIPMLIKLKEGIECYVNRSAMLNTMHGCIEIE
jgi:phosphotransferase system enzyme I (PtsI)